MIWIKTLLYSASVLAILGVQLVLLAGSSATVNPLSLSKANLQQAQHDKQSSDDLPLPPRNPDSSSAGGRRNGGACPQDIGIAPADQFLTALNPITSPGLTLVEYPTFLVYVPQTIAQTAEFSLRTLDDQGVYRTTVMVSSPGVMSIRLPADAPPLAVGVPYIWSLNLICDPNNRLEDRFVVGTVQRTELEPARMRQIDQSTLAEQIVLYREEGIWYDAVSTLFEIQHTQPDDPNLGNIWEELLQSGGLGFLISYVSRP